MAKSTFLQNSLNNHVLDATPYTAPVTIYYGFWTVALTAAAHGATAGELAYNDYARIAVTNDGSKFSASAAGLITNTGAFAAPPPTGDGNASIVSAGCFDGNAGTSGDNLLYYDADVGPLTVLNGDTPPTIAVGDFDHQEG